MRDHETSGGVDELVDDAAPHSGTDDAAADELRAPGTGRAVAPDAGAATPGPRPVRRPGGAATAGELLRGGRERLGRSITDLSVATRIRAGLLQQFEDDDFSRSGGDFYARAHLKSLAAELSLDPQRLLAAYARTTGTSAPDGASGRDGRDGRGGDRNAMARGLGRDGNPPLHPARPRWAVLVAVVLVAVLGWGVYRIVTASPHSTAAPAGPASVVRPPATHHTTAAKATTKASTPTTVTPTVRVGLLAKKPVSATFATYRGTVLWHGTITPGTPRTVRYPGVVRVWVDKPGDATLAINGAGQKVTQKRFMVSLQGKLITHT